MIAFLSQSTQSMENFQATAKALHEKLKYLELRIYNTICFETIKMQKSTRQLAQEVDCMIVIGGRNSANTCELASLCSSYNVKVHHIETARELNADWFHDVTGWLMMPIALVILMLVLRVLSWLEFSVTRYGLVHR